MSFILKFTFFPFISLRQGRLFNMGSLTFNFYCYDFSNVTLTTFKKQNFPPQGLFSLCGLLL